MLGPQESQLESGSDLNPEPRWALATLAQPSGALPSGIESHILSSAKEGAVDPPAGALSPQKTEIHDA